MINWSRPHHAYHAREKAHYLQAVREKQAQDLAAATIPQPGAHPLESTEAEAGRLRQAVQDLEDAFFDEGRLEAEEWENGWPGV